MNKEDKRTLVIVGVGAAIVAGLALLGGEKKVPTPGFDAPPGPMPPGPGAPTRGPGAPAISPLPPGASAINPAPRSNVSVHVDRPRAALAQPPTERVSFALKGEPEDRVVAGLLREEILRRLADRGYAATFVRWRDAQSYPPNPNVVVAELRIEDAGRGAGIPRELAPGLTASLGGAPAPGPARPPSGYTFKGP